MKFKILFAALCVVAINLSAQYKYNDFKSMSGIIEKLGKDYPGLCTVKSLIKTKGGKDIFVITIGLGEKDSKPGIAIFGGVEGSHVLGKELALGFAESVLKDASGQEIQNLLNKITFYIFPDVSPDATEQFFADLKYERNVNTVSTDDDRDFTFDEDPFEDLNKDGLITQIRIKDPAGKLSESPEDKRIMTESAVSEGQSGGYLVFTEGIDNDKDNLFNEDGNGGVNFNRNFTYNYVEYGLNTGLHPVSEAETKAVADFLYDKFNIYSVISFGPQDNLGQPWKSSEHPSSDGRITSVMKSDEDVNKLVSDKYHEIAGVKGAPASTNSPGNFAEWAYYHYGRYSFTTPAWWFPSEKGKNSEAAFLKFAEKHNIKDPFVPWTEINIPEFQGKKTEVGGIKPFIMKNPPADTLGDLVARNSKFILAVAGMHPELEFLDAKTENAGENIFRVTLKIHNKGLFATCAEVGDINMWTRIMRISIEPASGQSIISGQKVQRVNRLEGNQASEFSWLFSGKGDVKITAGALNTGTIETTLELK